jgi:murein DD-endopeptidase MepM/ murein hydrolase activator NlpD
LHGRHPRAPLTTALLLVVLLPAVSIATPKTDLERTKGALRDVRKDLSRHRSTALALKHRIRRLDRDITTAQIALNRLDAHIARVRTEVRGAEMRLRKTRAEIDALEEVAVEQAVDLYKSGSTETLSAVLDARSISEVNDRIELLGIAAQDNTEQLVRYGRLRIQVQEQNRVLLSKRNQLTKARNVQADALAGRDALRSELSESLGELNEMIGRERTREGRLVEAAAELKEKIVAAQARSAVASLGTSAQGFIWPLNGPLTSPYGPRWGSMHTGIDIDGYTGQPVVAAKDGGVIYLGGGMTGYGNAVVLDHGGGISTLYAHLSAFETSTGAAVEQGDIVGYVGCTGNCYGDHLHFEVRVAGNPVNPLDYLP